MTTRLPTVSTKEARSHFAELVNRVAYGKERVMVTRRGKGIAALLPVEVLENLAFMDQLEDELDLEAAKEAFAEAKKLGTTPWSKIKSDLGL